MLVVMTAMLLTLLSMSREVAAGNKERERRERERGKI